MTLLKVTLADGSWEYDPESLLMSELRAVKSVTGWNRNEWQAELRANDADAVCALIWLLRKRAGEPDLRYTEVDGTWASLNVEDITPKPAKAAKASPPAAAS